MVMRTTAGLQTNEGKKSGFSVIIFLLHWTTKQQDLLHEKAFYTKETIQCSLTVNECDWHILAGNEERINVRLYA